MANPQIQRNLCKYNGVSWEFAHLVLCGLGKEEKAKTMFIIDFPQGYCRNMVYQGCHYKYSGLYKTTAEVTLCLYSKYSQIWNMGVGLTL